MTITSSTSTEAPPTRSPYARSTTATVVGGLFVLQLVTAMVGASRIQAFVDGDERQLPLTVGVLLMMISGVAVVAIGLLMYPLLKQVSPRLAAWYPALRIIECLVSASFGVYLLARLQVVPDYMLWVYVPTGLGGIVLNYLLLVSRMVPRAIAVLGLVGYSCLTIGVPLDLLGILDMNNGAGMLAVAPGGLFEVVVLPIWLLTRGFSTPSAAR